MNRTRMLALASVALALSVVVTFVVYRVLQARLRPPEEMTTLVVVNQKMPLGTRLTQSDLRLAPWPRAIVMSGSFSDIASVIGRGVVVPMEANEPVLDAKLAPEGAGGGMTTAIPEGMRAVAIRVNDVIGVAGFVLPGTRVDVILSGLPLGSSDEVAKIILENVQVLAAGQNVDRDSNGNPQTVQVITLLVTPEDTQVLALATAEGRLQLALRNPLDLEVTDPPAVRRGSLFAGSASAASAPTPVPAVQQAAAPAPRARAVPPPASSSPPPAPAPVPSRRIEVQLIQGNTSQVVTFEEDSQ